MDLFTHLNEVDSALDFAHDLLAENSPPPLDPGADDEMDEVDELDDSLFDFIASTPADVHVFTHWGSKTEENNQALKDNIAIVQDLPPAVESKSLFGGALNTEFNPLPSGNSPLPWEAFVQSHMQFNSDKTTITASTTTTEQAAAVVPAQEDQLDLSSLISGTPEDPLSSESFYSLSSLGLPAIKEEEAADEPLQPLSQNSQLESLSSTSTSCSEPVRTEEERKRRNRVYAKRSRDLKNQKYKEAMILNENLQARLKEREQKHHELELQHQKVLRRVQELEHRLEIYEKGVL